MRIRIAVFVATALGVGALPAQAEGTFDFLDPCIKSTRDFKADRSQTLATLEAASHAAATARSVPENVEAAWWADVRKLLRKRFDTDVAPELRADGVKPGQMDARFEHWLDERIKAEGGKAQIEKVMLEQYRARMGKAIEVERATTEADFAKAKDDLDKSCRMGVGDQVLRVALGAAVAPIATVADNFEAAKDERGVVAQAVRLGTGVSLTDIEHHGLGGGDNSEVNKGLRRLGLK